MADQEEIKKIVEDAIKEDEKPEEKSEERVFKDTPLTIQDMMKEGIEILDFMEKSRIPEGISLDWAMLIRLCNAMLVSGKPLTLETPFKEAVDILGKVLKSAFL